MLRVTLNRGFGPGASWPLGPLEGPVSNPSMPVPVVEIKINFPGTATSSVQFLTRDLRFCPLPALKTNNLLLILTPCQFWFISTFPVRGSLCSLELQFSQPHLSSPPLSSQSNVHSKVFVLIALLPSYCWLVLYRDRHWGREAEQVSHSWWMDWDGG